MRPSCRVIHVLLLIALVCGFPSQGAGQSAECGTRSYTLPLVAGGIEAVEGQLPWHAAIYRRAGNGTSELICGGTLISAKFVVSAAHCFYNEAQRRPHPADKFQVALGKTSRAWDAGATFVSVQRMRVEAIRTPRFFYGSKGHFSHDIALVQLGTAARVSDTVRYACVDWDGEQPDWTSLPEASAGLVAGFGASAERHKSETLEYATLPLVPHDECAEYLHTTNEGHKLTADRLCVGYIGKGVGVCRGDSGGGLVTLNVATDRFFVRGLVSITLSAQALAPGQTCLSQHLAGFTDIAQHITWMKRFVDAAQRLSASGEPRPVGYERAENFGLYKMHEELRSWTQAVEVCRAEHGYLLILNSVEELQALKKKYAARMLHGAYYGAHHRKEQNKFVTIYDEPVENSGYNVWVRGYPGNFNHKDYPVLRVEMTSTETGLAVEKDWERRPFICKWTKRPAGYERVENFGFFKLHEELSTWAQAVATCRRERAYLLVLRSVDEFRALKKKYAARMEHGAYYGAHHRDAYHKFVTIFDEPLERTNYTVWQTGYPGSFNNKDYPVLRLEMSDTAPGLAVEKDWEHRPFICKFDLP